jgi:hypothetical protein
MHMVVDGLEEKELGGSSHGSDALFKKQQLMKTSDTAIGTTKRGTVPSELHTGLFLSATFAPLQALPYMNSRASDSIKATGSNVHHRHWSMLPNKQSGKKSA